MGEVKLFPMTYVSLEKEGRTASLVYADSSGLMVNVIDLPLTWVHSDAVLGVTRLISAGWVETGRGKVEL